MIIHASSAGMLSVKVSPPRRVSCVWRLPLSLSQMICSGSDVSLMNSKEAFSPPSVERMVPSSLQGY